jgi:hypothetical protein
VVSSTRWRIDGRGRLGDTDKILSHADEGRLQRRVLTPAARAVMPFDFGGSIAPPPRSMRR